MKQKTISFFRSLVDIRPGERSITMLMFFYLFLVIATFAVVKPVRSSLFLQYFGAKNLPYIYLATALLAGAIAWVHSRLLDRFDIVAVQVFTHLFFISNLVLFWFAFREEGPWLSAAFFLWVNVFTVTANTLFWMFANHYYYAREAKRLYGFINAGGTVGAVVSGLAVAALAQNLGTENLLLLCCAILGACIALIYVIRGLGRDRLGGGEAAYTQTTADVARATHKEGRRDLASLFQSSYPKYIAAALGLSLVVSILIDYQFNFIVEEQYTDTDARTAFFGTFMAAVNALSFVLQFFLTGWFLKTLGIGFALLFLPATLLGGSLWMAALPGLGGVLFLKLADGSIRYSIEQSTRDVLYLPIPNQLMGKLKAFVDVFVQRLGKGLGSVLILALTVWWTLGLAVLTYISIGLALGWAAMALLLRREYPEQLKQFLGREDLPEENKFVRVLDETTTARLLEALESRDERTALYCLELLEGTRGEEFQAILRNIVRTGSPRLQARALHQLADLGDTLVVEQAEQLLRFESIEVREEAIHYLCAASKEDPSRKMQEFLSTQEPRLRAAALACMANCGGAQGEQMAQKVFQEVASQGEAGRILLAHALGHIKPPSALHFLLKPLLEDSSEAVARAALGAAPRIQRREFVPSILERLSDPAVQADALEALQGYGQKVLGTLRDHFNDEAVPTEVRQLLPSVFVSVGTEGAARDLLSCLPQADTRLTYQVIKALNKMRGRQPDLQLSRGPLERILAGEVRQAYRMWKELHLYTSGETSSAMEEEQIERIDGLKQSYQQGVELVFRILGLLFIQRDIYTAYRGLNSPRPEVKANAIELLDNLLPGEIKKNLLPLVDDQVPVEEKLRIGESLS